MASAQTYVPIATTILASNAATYSFTSIPQSYTDLLLVASVLHTTTNQNTLVQFNSDTGTNYSATYMYGTGSSAASGRATNATVIYADYSSTTSNFSMFRMNIMNYSNTTTYKSILSRNDEPTATQSLALTGSWHSASAINTINISISGGNLGANSTFTLYGIAAA